MTAWSTLFSSGTDDWSTDQDIFDYLNAVFQFTLDPCASEQNHKCERYYTVEQDGLLQSWQGERVFMNPPYGRAIYEWMRKAYQEARGGALIVCLVPARTDTKWWHDFAIKGEVHLLRGRLKFGKVKGNAPFPSAVVIFYPQGILADRDPLSQLTLGEGAD